jgi:hypothetical protein
MGISASSGHGATKDELLRCADTHFDLHWFEPFLRAFDKIEGPGRAPS